MPLNAAADLPAYTVRVTCIAGSDRRCQASANPSMPLIKMTFLTCLLRARLGNEAGLCGILVAGEGRLAARREIQITRAGPSPALVDAHTIFSWPFSSLLSLSSSPSRFSFKVDLGIVVCGLRSAPPSHNSNDSHRCSSSASEKTSPEIYAWCIHSMPRRKTIATPLSSTIDDGFAHCAFAATSRSRGLQQLRTWA